MASSAWDELNAPLQPIVDRLVARVALLDEHPAIYTDYGAVCVCGWVEALDAVDELHHSAMVVAGGLTGDHNIHHCLICLERT